LKRLQGAWVLVASTVDGKPASECERRLVIQGNRMKWLDDEGTYELVEFPRKSGHAVNPADRVVRLQDRGKSLPLAGGPGRERR
jgi:hypothetical protein